MLISKEIFTALFCDKIITIKTTQAVLDTLDFNSDLAFDEFPPTSTEQWESVIEKDLKGKNYKETLVWNPDNDIQVLPFYRHEHLKDLSLSPQPVRGEGNWSIVQPVLVKDIGTANRTALNALVNGASGLYFYGDSHSISSDADLQQISLKSNSEQLLQVLNFLKY